MSVIGFDHFNIRAPRPLLDAVREFYVQTLGLKVGARPAVASYGYWLYLAEQPVVHLVEWVDAPDVDMLPRGCLDHIAFSCDDFEGTMEHLDALGVAYRRRNLEDRGQAITQLNITDPTGNVVELNFKGDKGR